MTWSTTASSINTVGSPLNAGGDTMRKVLVYAWNAGGITSATLTSTDTGLTSAVFAVSNLTSGTYVTTLVDTDAGGAGYVKIIPAGINDTGNTIVFGY